MSSANDGTKSLLMITWILSGVAAAVSTAALVISILAVTEDPPAPQVIPESVSSEYTKAFVDMAISRYESAGREAAIEYYNSRESVDGEWYVFVLDESGIMVAHPTMPENIGKDIKGPLGKDVTGYDFGSAMLALPETGGWVDFFYLNPATGEESRKHVWAVRRDGLVFGSGWYER